MRTRNRDLPTFEIHLPKPPMGNKVVCLRNQGTYILERGPVIWRSLANTHVGTGSVAVYDGIPTPNGFFPDDDIPLDDPRYATANGRLLYQANPSVMGMWMFDGYAEHGLTVICSGEHNISPVVSITWLPYVKPVQRQAVAVPVEIKESKGKKK